MNNKWGNYSKERVAERSKLRSHRLAPTNLIPERNNEWKDKSNQKLNRSVACVYYSKIPVYKLDVLKKFQLKRNEENSLIEISRRGSRNLLPIPAPSTQAKILAVTARENFRPSFRVHYKKITQQNKELEPIKNETDFKEKSTLEQLSGWEDCSPKEQIRNSFSQIERKSRSTFRQRRELKRRLYDFPIANPAPQQSPQKIPCGLMQLSKCRQRLIMRCLLEQSLRNRNINEYLKLSRLLKTQSIKDVYTDH